MYFMCLLHGIQRRICVGLSLLRHLYKFSETIHPGDSGKETDGSNMRQTLSLMSWIRRHSILRRSKFRYTVYLWGKIESQRAQWESSRWVEKFRLRLGQRCWISVGAEKSLEFVCAQEAGGTFQVEATATESGFRGAKLNSFDFNVGYVK